MSGPSNSPNDHPIPDSLEGLRAELAKAQDEVCTQRGLLLLADTRIKDLARRDPLTGLPNRSALFDELTADIHAAEADGSTIILAKFNIHHFNHLYRACASQTSDHLLKLFACELRITFETDHFVARVGTDDFAVIFCGSSVDTAQRSAEDFVGRAMTLIPRTGVSLPSRISGGIARFPQDAHIATDLVDNAAVALLYARTQRHACVVLFDREMRAKSNERARLISSIWAGIKNNEFIMFYQPIISLSDGDVSGLEALMRWNKPRHGLLTPWHFLAGFEEPELSVELGDVALELVIGQMRKWLDAGVAFGKVAVNLSTAQLQQPHFTEMLLSKLERASVPPNRMIVELTENIYMGGGSEDVKGAIQAMHQSGMEIALDDFGTGFASLSHLHEFPIDKLKLDKSFVQSVESAPIVQAVIRMGHSMGMTIVAEGVEKQEQLERLHGVDFIQGFIFSEPMSQDKVGCFIRDFTLPSPGHNAASASHDPEIESLVGSHNPAELLVVDSSGTIIYGNRRWNNTAKCCNTSTQGVQLNYITECKASIRRNCREAAAILEGLEAVLQGTTSSFTATYSCPFGGIYHWYQVLISALTIKGKRCAILFYVDVSVTQSDPDTGLPNRAMFDAQLDLAISIARDGSGRTGISILHINTLNRMNDTNGHSVRDETLKAFSSELKKSFGPECVVARIGGDEFGVVHAVSYEFPRGRRVAGESDSQISCSIESARGPQLVSASVGTAFYPEDGTAAKELFKSAEKRMYAHKRPAFGGQVTAARVRRGGRSVEPARKNR
jgi:diguanylate cyclase (GGDEF)-like protein